MDGSNCLISQHFQGWIWPWIKCFGVFLPVKSDDHGPVWHMRGRLMPSQTFICWYMYWSNVLKYVNSNGWFSLYHIIPFTRLKVPPNFGIMILVVLFPGRIRPNVKYYGLSHDSASLLLLNIHPSKVLQHFRSNGWPCLSPTSQFLGWEWTQNQSVHCFFFARISTIIARYDT